MPISKTQNGQDDEHLNQLQVCYYFQLPFLYNRLLGQGGHNELDDFFDPECADSFLSCHLFLRFY
jgi:hypothetical protein